MKIVCPNCNGAKVAPRQTIGVCYLCGGAGEVIRCTFCQDALWLEDNKPRSANMHRCWPMLLADTHHPEQAFKELCERHDLTYSFSDDGNVCRGGQQQRDQLMAFARKYLTPERAATIWNAVVDTKISKEPEIFYWRP